MKKILAIAFVLIAATVYAETANYRFNGAWLPSLPPTDVGPENFVELQNMQYTDTGMIGVKGYTEINTTAIPSTTDVLSGFHYSNSSESSVILKTYDGTNYELKENTTAVPSQGDFSGTDLYTVSSGTGSYAMGPFGVMAYVDDSYNLVWGGNNFRLASFLTSDDSGADGNRDYTSKINNTLSSDFATVGEGGNDSDTVLLLHLDGADGASSTTDSSATGHTITMTNALLDTDQAKFGVSSCDFDGTGDYLTVPDHADFDFSGGGNFTIDFWVRWDAVPTTTQSLFAQNIDATHYINLAWYDTGDLSLGIVNTTQVVGVSSGSWTPAADTWYHIAVIRGWGGNANDWAITINGTQSGSTVTDSDSPQNYTSVVWIGSYGGSSQDFDGWMDEFRVSTVARWTDDFEVPVRAFSDSHEYIFIGSPLILDGVNLYLSDVNATTSTITATEWNGSSWSDLTETDNTASGGVSLAQNGTITWTSTTAKKRYLDGAVLYWYRLQLSAGSATIYNATGRTSFQGMTDVWNLVNRTCISFQASRSSEYEDYTSQVANAQAVEGAEYTATIGGLTSSDHIIIMFDDRIMGLDVTMFPGKANGTAVTISSVKFWNGDEFESVGEITDGTLDSGSTDTLNQSGVISWTPPGNSEEFKHSLFGVTGYAYEIKFSDTLETGTDYDGTSIDALYGIPAPLEIKGYDYVSSYKSRLMLVDDHRVFYSQSGAPWIWNGTDSSDGGIYAISFGDSGQITAGQAMFNRYGSSLIESWVATKNTETYLLTGSQPHASLPEPFIVRKVSPNIGCPAPMTMISVEVGFEVEDGLKRNAVIWLDSNGPVLFDGAVVVPIGGLENYFDKSETECINYSYIDQSMAFLGDDDSYHLLIPSGASTTLNKWFRLDLEKMRWSEIVPTTYPQATFNVEATNGAKYAYGAVATGTMYRLENGNTWDGDPIWHIIKTGEFFPHGPWEFTEIQKLKLLCRAVTEDTDVTVRHWADGDESGTWTDTIAYGTAILTYSGAEVLYAEPNHQVALDSSDSVARHKAGQKSMGAQAYAHQIAFSCSTSSSEFEPIGWGVKTMTIRED